MNLAQSNGSIRIKRIERRNNDYWIDMETRTVRICETCFYNVTDPLTGKWLFKICIDKKLNKTIVKALKCPSGEGFVQLEGRTMLFQKSLEEDYLYDIISLTYLDDNKRLKRKIVSSIELIPTIIRNNFKIMSYEEATGKKAIGKKYVTLVHKEDKKKIIMLFLFERAWPIANGSDVVGVYATKIFNLIQHLEKASLKEIYENSSLEFSLARVDVDMILNFLEEKGKIDLKEDYIKSKS